MMSSNSTFGKDVATYYKEKGAFIPSMGGLSPKELLSEVEEKIWNFYKSGTYNERAVPTVLGMGLFFSACPEFPENFFQNELDDVVSAFTYIVPDRQVSELGDGITFLLYPYIMNSSDPNTSPLVMYRVGGTMPIPDRNPEFPCTPSPFTVPLDILYQTEDYIHERFKHIPRDFRKRIVESRDRFAMDWLSHPAENRLGCILSISAGQVEEILNTVVDSGYDVKNYNETSFMLSPPSKVKSARK